MVTAATIICVPLAFFVGLSAYTQWFGILCIILFCLFVTLSLCENVCTVRDSYDAIELRREHRCTPPYQNRNIEYRNPFERRSSRVSPVRITIRFGDRPTGGIQIAQPVPEVEEKIPEDTDAASQEESCVVCLVHKKNHVAMPCRHLCLCGTCKSSGKVTSCPMCREPNITFMLVY